MAKKSPKILQSSFLRASKIFASGARMAAREISSQISGGVTVATRLKQAQDLVATLGELKGAAMKAGQLLSIEAAQYLPPEVVTVLRQLQDQTSFMPLDQVRFILQRQLGREKFEMIEDLSAEPIAAASIGQVHKATIGGKSVAIKVQYPGVASSIDADLYALRKIAIAAVKIMGKNVDLSPVLDEITKSLKQEVNYRIEADNLDLTKRELKNPNFIIPEVYREYSTDTVLTLSFEHGVKISEWMKTELGREEREYVSQLIVNLLIDEVLTTGVVQTDPNFANFLYRPEERKLVLLDFGATWVYETELRTHIQSQVVSLFDGKIDHVMEQIHERGYLSRKENDEAKEEFRRILAIVSDLAKPELQPMSLNDSSVAQKFQVSAQKLGMAIEHTAPPKDLVLIGRKVGGMLAFLREIGSEIDLVDVKERLAAVKI
jgi:aarF domain-containing kinase